MKSEGPGSPFCEPAGLLELVSPPCLLSDRRICVDASSCRHLMHSGEKKPGMPHSCEDSKENVHIKPLNKPKQLKAMKSDGNKKALGERDLNLVEDRAGNVVVDTSPRTENADIQTCASTGLSMESILEILEEDKDRLVSDECDVGLDDLPPYHPISAPFSPRPQFLRLKRTSGPSTRAQEELEAELPPYDPDLNPLSPRPRFLRYNPLKRMDFLRAQLNEDVEISEGKSLDFSIADKGIQDEFGNIFPSMGQTRVGLTRSASCPELFDISAEEKLPPLEKSQNVPMKGPTDPEDDTESHKTAVDDEPTVARRFNRGAAFRRTLLLCLFLACIATSCFIVRENPSLLRSFQRIRFPAWEWTEGDDQDVKYSGYSNTITAVANYSLFNLPVVDEEIVLSLSDAEDFLPKIGEEDAAVSDFVFVRDGMDEPSYLDDSPTTDEDASEECPRVDWEERVLNICLDRAISLAELSVAAHGTEDSSSHTIETDWRLLDEATVTEDWDATQFSSLNEEIETSGADSSTPVSLNTEEALQSDHSQISKHTSMTQGDADLRINLFDRLFADLLGNFRLFGSNFKSLPSSFQDDNSLLRLSFVVCGVSLLIGAVTMFSRFRVEAPVRAVVLPNDAVTRAAPETTSETSDDSFSGSSSESTYGSFTKMEPMVLTRGQVTLTPVRRSSRIRSRIHSPNLKA